METLADRRPKHETLGDAVHDSLLREIISGRLAPGHRLRADDLGRRFHTSRTPIREALGRLRAAGLVDVERNARTAVASWQVEDIAQRVRIATALAAHGARALPSRAVQQAPAVGIGDWIQSLSHFLSLCEWLQARAFASAAELVAPNIFPPLFVFFSRESLTRHDLLTVVENAVSTVGNPLASALRTTDVGALSSSIEIYGGSLVGALMTVCKPSTYGEKGFR